MEEEATLLIVDDEAPIRRVLMGFLEDIPEWKYFRVIEAADGQAALDLIRAGEVDMVLADVKMPRLSGFDLLAQVKAKWPHILFIILTGYSDTYSRKEALLLGAEDYLTKPFSREEVELVVRGAYWKVMANRLAP